MKWNVTIYVIQTLFVFIVILLLSLPPSILLETEMEESKTVEYKNIRKLRKKLRQIEYLELLNRELNEEEIIKVKKILYSILNWIF